jgi:hypothetical protein
VVVEAEAEVKVVTEGNGLDHAMADTTEVKVEASVKEEATVVDPAKFWEHLQSIPAGADAAAVVDEVQASFVHDFWFCLSPAKFWEDLQSLPAEVDAAAVVDEV